MSVQWVMGLCLGAAALGGCGGSTKSQTSRDPVVAPETGDEPADEGNPQQGGRGNQPEPVATPPVCETWPDAAPRAGGKVKITNQRAEPIYLGQAEMNCARQPRFEIRDEAGLVPAGDRSSGACADVMAGHVGINLDCPRATTLRLASGESVELDWSGQRQVVHEVPGACIASNFVQDFSYCWQLQPIAAGAYTFTSRAGRSTKCSYEGLSCDTCEPNAEGGCNLWQAELTDLDLSAETKIQLGAELQTVEIVFRE